MMFVNIWNHSWFNFWWEITQRINTSYWLCIDPTARLCIDHHVSVLYINYTGFTVSQLQPHAIFHLISCISKFIHSITALNTWSHDTSVFTLVWDEPVLIRINHKAAVSFLTSGKWKWYAAGHDGKHQISTNWSGSWMNKTTFNRKMAFLV